MQSVYVTLGLRLPPETKEALDGRARTLGISLNELIVTTLNKELGVDTGFYQRVGRRTQKSDLARQLRISISQEKQLLRAEEEWPDRLKPTFEKSEFGKVAIYMGIGEEFDAFRRKVNEIHPRGLEFLIARAKELFLMTS